MQEVMDNIMVQVQEDNEALEGKYLTFWTDGQLYGVPIADVVQIVGMQEITPVPEFPDYAKGIINLRGSIIPVIDVRLRFGREEREYSERTCIIVTNLGGIFAGFAVDGVDEVTDISDSDISEPPKVSKDYTNAYLTGIGKHNNKVVLILDTSKILNGSDMEILSQAAE